MRLIDADRLKSYIDCGHLRPPTEVCFSELDVCNMIDKAPTVSAETAQGEWIIHGDPPWVVRECSQCGTKWHHWSGGANPNYCGHCGARMKGGGSE